MEISKSLQQEIHAVQNKLKNAIQSHQVYVGKLSSDPNNEELVRQIRQIQDHIVSLSKCQKQVVQRLRKEVKLYEAANTNGNKVSIATLLGLNNNNNITNNNEPKNSDSEETNDKHSNETSRRSSKDDYEDDVRNVEPRIPSEDSKENCPQSKPTLGPGSPDNEKAGEVVPKEENYLEEKVPFEETLPSEQLNFLTCLGLITKDKHSELQSKRAERKRRSTANPQFVYSNWEIPTKRKRHAYLQSNGSAPQTRQTTARLNDPSPPPTKSVSQKVSSLPRLPVKSLIPTQKSTNRPNILRSAPDSKVFTSNVVKNKSDNGSQGSNAKQGQNTPNKTVRIPGLPSSLTIERIEEDAPVCIRCRKPGSLGTCETCSSRFHVSCHLVPPGSEIFCPTCFDKTEQPNEDEDTTSSSILSELKREDEELATTSVAAGTVGEAGEDAEVDKTTSGFHTDDATEERCSSPGVNVNVNVNVNRISPSTFLIPIPSTSVASSNTSEKFVPEAEQSTSTSPSYSPVVIGQPTQSSNYGKQSVSYAYQLPVINVQPEKSTSYLIVKKISGPRDQPERRLSENSKRPVAPRHESGSFDDHDQFELRPILPAEELSRRQYAVFEPKLHSEKCHEGEFSKRIVETEGGPGGGGQTVTAKRIPRSTIEKHRGRRLDKFEFSRRGGTEDNREMSNKQIGESEFRKRFDKSHARLNINKLRPNQDGNTFIPLHNFVGNSSGSEDPFGPGQERGINAKDKRTSIVARTRTKKNLLYSLFASNKIPYRFTDSSSDHEGKSAPSDGNPESPTRVYASPDREFGEYVKLEEAHLPAPLRSNLEWDELEDDASSDEDDGEVSRLRISLDESPEYERIDDPINEDSANDETIDYTATFDSYRADKQRSGLKFARGDKSRSNYAQTRLLVDENESKNRYPFGKKFVAIAPKEKVIQRTYSVRRTRVLRPKPEPVLRENRSITIENAERIQEELCARRTEERKMSINVVSTENMKVLEQFESAMLDAGEFADDDRQ